MYNPDGTRSKIECLYFRGEKLIWQSKSKSFNWKADGYVKNSNGVKIYEFYGCHVHSGCPNCKTRPDKQLLEKRQDIINLGYELDEIWSCQFRKLLPKIRHLDSRNFPGIFRNNHTESDILNGIKDGSLFGYIIADISSPQNVIEEWKDFPPVSS